MKQLAVIPYIKVWYIERISAIWYRVDLSEVFIPNPLNDTDY